MPTYQLASGEVVEYSNLAPPVAAFLARVESAVANPTITPAALLALVYSAENPTLDIATALGHALITPATLADPVFHVLTDLAFRKQLAASGKTIDDVAAQFTVSVQDAADQLGITEASVRAAISGRKLAAHKRNGQWYTTPGAVAAYKVSNRGRKKASALATSAETDSVRVRCGSDAGGSLAVRIEGADLVTEGKDGDAVLARFPAGWSRALVKTTTKEGVRVFEIEPAAGAAGTVEHLGLYVRGPFEVVKRYNNTRAANAAWKTRAAAHAN